MPLLYEEMKESSEREKWSPVLQCCLWYLLGWVALGSEVSPFLWLSLVSCITWHSLYSGWVCSGGFCECLNTGSFLVCRLFSSLVLLVWNSLIVRSIASEFGEEFKAPLLFSFRPLCISSRLCLSLSNQGQLSTLMLFEQSVLSLGTTLVGRTVWML